MKVETHGYSGKISKPAQVYSNDPRDRVIDITVEATIMQLLNITPPSVFLEAQKGQTVTASVVIRSETDKPLQLVPAGFDLQDKITYSVEEVEKGKVYRVHFSNAPGATGIVTGHLSFRTGYPEKPVVTIRIRGKFRE